MRHNAGLYIIKIAKWGRELLPTVRVFLKNFERLGKQRHWYEVETNRPDISDMSFKAACRKCSLKNYLSISYSEKLKKFSPFSLAERSLRGDFNYNLQCIHKEWTSDRLKYPRWALKGITRSDSWKQIWTSCSKALWRHGTLSHSHELKSWVGGLASLLMKGMAFSHALLAIQLQNVGEIGNKTP